MGYVHPYFLPNVNYSLHTSNDTLTSNLFISYYILISEIYFSVLTQKMLVQTASSVYMQNLVINYLYILHESWIILWHKQIIYINLH